MEIAIFEDVTTEKSLVEIEKESKKYEGLYVEMENKEERKYVKDKALLINNILKKVDRARIDKSKEFKMLVESEALRIKNRLEDANKPFTLLIDEYKEVREKQLIKEKEIREAKELAEQIPIDHDEAILINKMRDFEKAEIVREQKERDELIVAEAKKEAEAKAKQAEIDKILAQEQTARNAEIIEEQRKQAEIDAENAEKKRLADVKREERIGKELALKAAIDAKQKETDRINAENKTILEQQQKLEANKKHVGAIRCEIKKHLMSSCEIEEKLAKSIVLALLKTDRITVNY